mmetsp:Transcript_12143/g.22740  ORF Transcript_12143/g.22740 Transcript_12143/m.22740 type:complete len:1192 (-) Transcript_12143:62-3637(-)
MSTLEELVSESEFPSIDWDTSPSPFSVEDNNRPSSFLQKTVAKSHRFQNSMSEKNGRENITSPRMIIDSIPFRDRYSNAALVSKRLNSNSNLDTSFASREDELEPRQLFSSGVSENLAGVSSPNGKQYDNYFTVGEQSVFSDITESGLSGNVPASSPFLEAKRKLRNMNMNETSPRGERSSFKDYESADDSFRIRNQVDARRVTDDITRNKMLNSSIEDGYDVDNENKVSSRLATFFASRSLTWSKKVPPKSEPCAEEDSGMQIHGIKKQIYSSLTPTGSASESSSGYVGWPGTLDKNGCTVVENTSLSTAEDLSNVKESTVVNNNHASDHVAKVWLHQNHLDETVKASHIRVSSTCSGSETTNDADQTKQPFTAVARARVADLKRRFEQRHTTKGEKVTEESGTISRIKSQSNKAKTSEFRGGGALERSASKVNDQRLNRSHDFIIPEDESVEMEHYDLNRTFPGAYPLTDQSVPKINMTPSLRRMELAGKSLISRYRNNMHDSESSSSPVRLSAAALREKDFLTSSFQTIAHGANVKGFRGFINKTMDIPNLMDDVESVTSASTSAAFRKQEYGDVESDVFDGVGSVDCATLSSQNERNRLNEKMNGNDNSQTINVLKLKCGISSVQTSPECFDKRMTSADFDAGLSESDTDHAMRLHIGKKNNNPVLPGHYDEISSRDTESDNDESASTFSGEGILDGTCDLSIFAVSSSQVRKFVKAYRSMSQFVNAGMISQHEEDAKKAFALLEMRSRIMQTDIERGFDRTGGTITVDDLVMTRYFKACCRVRDAVIVSKAWRDGATPQDARTALNLTEDRDFYVKRINHMIHPSSNLSFDQQSINSSSSQILVSYERIGWIDDTDFSLIKCFGAKILRGPGIFTVGDCQSMLLKLTHEHLENVREEVKGASSRLLIAEQMLKDEGFHSSSMTEAEIEYLEIMEDVKLLATKQSKAEKAFNLVKSEIEDLVQQYEDILEQMDDENSSVSSYDSAEKSDIEDNECYSSDDSYYEKERLARRVQRAELKAEVAAREAQLAKIEMEKTKQEAERIRLEKEEELQLLKQKLEDLEAKSAIISSDFEAKLTSQKLIEGVTQKKKVSFDTESSQVSATDPKSWLYAASAAGSDPDQNETKARVKAKFRQRRSKLHEENVARGGNPKDSNNQQIANKHRISGQVHQRLEFYERSLQSVQAKNM